MTYHRPLFIGNVLKVRLSCVKPPEKNREKISKKITVRGKKIKIGVEYIPLVGGRCKQYKGGEVLADFITPPSPSTSPSSHHCNLRHFFIFYLLY